MMRERYGAQYRTVEGVPEVNQARSMLANMALNMGAEILIWIDADNTPVSHNPGYIELVKACREDSGVHSGVYVKQLQKAMAMGVGAFFALSVVVEPGTKVVLGPGAPRFQAKEIGLGAAAVHRCVFEEMEPIVPRVRWGGDPQADGAHYFMPMTAGDRYLADDAVFSHRARALDFDLTVHGSVTPFHWKTMGLVPALGQELEIGEHSRVVRMSPLKGEE